MNPLNITGNTGRRAFPLSRYLRYLFSLLLIAGMTGVAEATGEKEIIFPEMAALCTGMWVVDKRVWTVSRLQMILLLTAGATAGVLIVRLSPGPLLLQLGMAFAFAATSLILSRTSLIPVVSACMLPVLLRTESWVYPLAVGVLSAVVAAGQWGMEKSALRSRGAETWKGGRRRTELVRWAVLLVSVLTLAAWPAYASYMYCILPPLIVTYVEFASSRAGFRNRPVQIFLLLTGAACIGAFFQAWGFGRMGWSEAAVATADLICVYALFEWTGKCFAPAGAVALIPMLIPAADLMWFPLQVALGAAMFIATALVVFLKCYKWSQAQLLVCLLPAGWRPGRKERDTGRG